MEIFFLLFFSVLVQSKEVIKKDIFSRNYLQKSRGEIIFLLDHEYIEVVPHFSQLHIHQAEWKALVQAGKFLPALSLLQGLKYCVEKESPTQMQIWKVQLKEWNETINFIFNKFSDKLEEERKWIDPSICIKKIGEEEFYFFSSLDYQFQLKIPYKYRYSYPKIKQFQYEKTYKWTSFVFSSLISNLEPVRDDLEFWLQVLSKKIPLPKSRWKKLYIFFLDHKLDELNENLVLSFWDLKRGLTSQNQQRVKFERKGEESKFQVLSEDGREENYICKEKILIRKNKAIALFFVFPEFEREEVERDWKKIIESLGP